MNALSRSASGVSAFLTDSVSALISSLFFSYKARKSGFVGNLSAPVLWSSAHRGEASHSEPTSSETEPMW